MRWPRGIDGLCYGGDYNPEQWPEAVWAQDVALMRRARVNLVTVGVFAWSRLEPHPGRYDFDWLDRVLELLHGNGIRVALATPTASPPPWFSLAHPDALPVTADGVRLHHGSRDTYCAAAPAYRTAARDIATALATRYRHHPALALWHVHNEYGTTCHCPYAAEAFRCWLRARHADLDRLNDAWSTSFWSQHYSDWAQILPPRATQYLANPAHLLDFRRFWSDELLAAYVEQRDLLRAATPQVPVTTNYVLGDWVPVDHARWSGEVDLVAIDHYPTAADRGAEAQIAFAADLARSWARRVRPGDTGASAGDPGAGWLLMESAPNLIHVPGRMHSREPGRLARHSLAYVARGSRGAMFFQWRAPSGGAERFHSALLPHAGPDSRVFRETVELGETLSELSKLSATELGAVEARVAIGWDTGCRWALAGPGLPSASLGYLDEVGTVHRLCWQAGIATDFVGPDQLATDPVGPDEFATAAVGPHGRDTNATPANAIPATADAGSASVAGGGPPPGYALLLLPALYLVSDLTAARVRDWVAAGGHLLVGYLSGVADEHGRIRLGGYPGAFREVLGITVEEFHPLAERERLPVVEVDADEPDTDEDVPSTTGRTGTTEGTGRPEGTGRREGIGTTGRLWSETVRLAGARTVLAYGAGRLAGRPAVTRHRFGAGVAWYVSTRLDDAAHRRLLERVAADAGVTPTCPSAPDGVEAVRRRDPAGRSWLFLLNHDPEPRSVPVSGTPLLTTAPDHPLSSHPPPEHGAADHGAADHGSADHGSPGPATGGGGGSTGPPVIVPPGGYLVLREH